MSADRNEASPEKHKALDLAVTQIERQFGKGSIMKLGDRDGMDIPVISSSSLSIDYALGVGGVREIRPADGTSSAAPKNTKNGSKLAQICAYWDTICVTVVTLLMSMTRP